LGKKNDIEVEEKKAKRYRLPDGVEFYIIDDIVLAETEGGASVGSLSAQAKRTTKRYVHALIVRDPKFPTMPYDVWQEKMRETVMGTLRTDIPFADIPHSDSISVTASPEVYEGVECKECGRLIHHKETKCPHCGALSPTA